MQSLEEQAWAVWDFFNDPTVANILTANARPNPVLILHGVQDRVVNIRNAGAWAYVQHGERQRRACARSLDGVRQQARREEACTPNARTLPLLPCTAALPGLGASKLLGSWMLQFAGQGHGIPFEHVRAMIG